MTNPATSELLDSRTVGEIAATLPGATGVFRRFKLDFCCGGDVALADAAAERGIDLAELRKALAALDWGPAAAPEATGELVDHIVTRYHEAHRRELPELISLARKVESVHRGNPEAPLGLADALEAMRRELEEHMQKEETVIFPSMLQGGHAVIVQPITDLRHDHDDHGEHLRGLERITNDFQLPSSACRSWQALYAGTAKMCNDLMEHIHLENNVLFPRFETRNAV